MPVTVKDHGGPLRKCDVCERRTAEYEINTKGNPTINACRKCALEDKDFWVKYEAIITPTSGTNHKTS